MQRNRLEVAGYLAAKPALRRLPSGTPVANVRLGESYRYQDGDGKPQHSALPSHGHPAASHPAESPRAGARGRGDDLQLCY